MGVISTKTVLKYVGRRVIICLTGYIIEKEEQIY